MDEEEKDVSVSTGIKHTLVLPTPGIPSAPGAEKSLLGALLTWGEIWVWAGNAVLIADPRGGTELTKAAELEVTFPVLCPTHSFLAFIFSQGRDLPLASTSWKCSFHSHPDPLQHLPVPACPFPLPPFGVKGFARTFWMEKGLRMKVSAK